MDLKAHAEGKLSDSGYIPTSTSPNIAREFAEEGGYVYTLKNVKGGVNVNSRLGKASPFARESEIAIPYMIPGSNIVGARKVGADGKFAGPFIKNTSK